MNEFVLKPRVFCRVKNLYEPVNRALESGNLAAAPVAGRPDVQRYYLPASATGIDREYANTGAIARPSKSRHGQSAAVLKLIK
ncbi:MAG TPA: hypothetical protein VGM09_28765 [Bradyrhizobium sp.]|jgi:hypothetical protein